MSDDDRRSDKHSGGKIESSLERIKHIGIVAIVTFISTAIIGAAAVLDAMSKISEKIPLHHDEVAIFDSQTREQALQTAKLMDDFLKRAGVEQRSFESCKDDYRKIDVELDSLLLRNQTRPLNLISTEQIKIIIRMWSETEELHQKEGKLHAAFIEERWRQLRVGFEQILELESSKPTKESK